MDFEQWFDRIAAQGRFTRQQCRDIARESWNAALAACPGCPDCAAKDQQIISLSIKSAERAVAITGLYQQIADLQAKLDEATGRADRLHDLWNKVETKNDSLRALVCEEPIEHGAVAAIREVLALTDDNCGFVDDDVARVVQERNRLRALVEVGRETIDTLYGDHKAVDCPPGCVKCAALRQWRSLDTEETCDPT